MQKEWKKRVKRSDDVVRQLVCVRELEDVQGIIAGRLLEMLGILRESETDLREPATEILAAYHSKSSIKVKGKDLTHVFFCS